MTGKESSTVEPRSIFFVHLLEKYDISEMPVLTALNTALQFAYNDNAEMCKTEANGKN